MIKLIILFFGVAILNLQADSTNKYEKITKRNAFDLTEEKVIKILPPATNILRGEVYLTGITRINSVRKAHFVVKRPGAQDKFVSLRVREAQDGIRLEKVGPNSAFISDNGEHRLLSFEKHALPTIVQKSKAPKLMQRSEKRDDKRSDKKEVKKSEPRPSVVTVPSRTRRTDPRMQQMMERGLEYVSKIEDPQKREAMLERIEKFQRGDYNKEIQERMKRYEEQRRKK